jgi:hypothetical protein
MTFIGLIISKYDFPITTNWKDFYEVSIAHFYKNIGIFVVLAFIVAIISFLNVTLVYTASFVAIVFGVYFAKGVLANGRK